jgi:hypothetical protein
MFCPSCGVAAQPGQKFCTSCGGSLTGVPLSDLPTAALPVVAAALPPPTLVPPTVAPVASVVALDPTVFDYELFDTTGSLGVVPAPTDVLPTQADGPVTADIPSFVEESQPFGLTPLLILAVLTGAVAVLAGVLDQVSYRVTGDINDALSLTMNDLSSNSLVACILAAVLLVTGAAIGATGRRIGVGLAGGTGLAVAGFMAWTAAQGSAVIDTLKMGLAEKGGTYRLTTTMAAGFWLAIAAAVLGAVVAGVSVTGALDRRARVHPGIGALGALGTLAVVVGPMLPMNGAALVDNFSSDHSVGPVLFWKSYFLVTLGVNHPSQPPITTYLRLLVLFLLAVGGLVGFIAGTRWGVGMVLGSFSIAAWVWITSLLEAGDRPFGIAGGNPGSVEFVPSVVTTIGMVVVLLAAVGAAASALRSTRV